MLEDNFVRRVEVLKIIDGDTIYLDIDLGFTVGIKVKARLFGIDTPEKFGVKKWEDKDAGVFTEEYQLGVLASQYTLTWIIAHAKRKSCVDLFGTEFQKCFVVMKSHKGKAGKYGRWLAVIHPADDSEMTLNDALVNSGNAELKDY
jgi:micrococcal nuclease